MKGIVFSEFLEMVEAKFGLEVVDSIIEDSNLPSEGIYTSVGTYEFNEMLELITSLSDQVKIDIPTLIHAFGRYLFDSFTVAHPDIIKSYNNPISLLFSIEDHIHVHVKKLYPEAELPTFKILERTDRSIVMVYSSSRALYRLANGLIEKCFEHFNSSAEVTYELLKEDGTKVKFEVVQNG